MKIPIDPKTLLDEVSNIDEAQATELSVSVYVDEKAPSDVVAHVRNAFASSLRTVRMTLSYLDSKFIPNPTDDIAVIVAGNSATIGAAAAAIRAVGVPVMVVAMQPSQVGTMAERNGNPIPEGDLVSPFDEDSNQDVVDLDDELANALDDRMGRWIVAACRDKCLAFAIAFPFMRRPLAKDAVITTAVQNAGVGLVAFIPGADLPIMTLNQAKMVLQIAAAYGRDMNKDRVKELAAVVGGAFVCRALARKIVGFAPILGWIAKPGIAYGGTAALGYAIIEYFEGGEDATGVANVAEKATEKGTQVVSGIRNFSFDPSSIDVRGAVKKIRDYAPVVKEKAVEYAPVVKEAASSIVQDAVTVASAVSSAVSEGAAR